MTTGCNAQLATGVVCGRPKVAQGLCWGHYRRLLRNGTTGISAIGESLTTQCSIPWCSEQISVHSRSGLCKTHHTRLKRTGKVTRVYEDNRGKLCLCGRPATRKGLCGTCYARSRRVDTQGG